MRGLLLLTVFVLGLPGPRDARAQVQQDPELVASRLLVRGMTRSFLGDHEGALEMFDQALRFQPENAAIQAAMARVYLDLDNLVQASFYAERAVSIDPAQADNQLLAAELRRLTGDPVGSLGALDEAARLRPSDPLIQVDRARTLAALEQRRAAADAYHAALGGGARTPAVLGEYLEVQIALGDLESALETASELRMLDRTPDVELTRARLLVQLGRNDEAADAFVAALDLDALSEEARAGLEAIAPDRLPQAPALENASPAEVARRLASAAEDDLRNVELRVEAVRATLRVRDLTTALRLAEDGLLFFPGHEDLTEASALAYLHGLRLARLEELGPELRREVGDTVPGVLEWLRSSPGGGSASGPGPLWAALADAPPAEASGPRSPLEWLLLGDRLSRSGRTADAVEAWRQALDGAPDSPVALSRLQ